MIETGVYFDELHSFHDLHLVLSSVSIPPATPKLNFVDIAGRDGSVDLSEVHGEIRYFDRELKFTFTALPMSAIEWERAKTTINNALNGKRIARITLEKDPEYYFTGRCAVNSYAIDRNVRQVVITATVNPWKLKQSPTVIPVELGGESHTVYLPNGRKTVKFTVECTEDGVKMLLGGVEYTLQAGISESTDFRLKEGYTPVTVSGNGTITFTYQEGEL